MYGYTEPIAFSVDPRVCERLCADRCAWKRKAGIPCAQPQSRPRAVLALGDNNPFLFCFCLHQCFDFYLKFYVSALPQGCHYLVC